jgi:hypothetical protein
MGESKRVAAIGGQGPLSGGYYWFPRRELAVVTWKVLTCHDLGFESEVGHADLWPSALDRLAHEWGKDRAFDGSRLANHYRGLPRGRVGDPDGRFLVCHGNDAPVGNWKTRVRRAFGLESLPLKAIFDEHETTLEEDRRMVESVLGIAIGRAGGPATGCRPREQDS